MPVQRRNYAPVALALFASQFALFEAIARGTRYSSNASFGLAALTSIAVWGSLAVLTTRRVAHIALALFAATIFVTELVFFRYYHGFIGDDAVACARAMWGDVRPVLRQMLPSFVVGALLVASLEFLLLSISARRFRRARRLLAFGASSLVVLALSVGAAPAELRALWSLRLVLQPRQAKAETRLSVPPLESTLPRLPNVLVILDESVRASDYSIARLEALDPSWRALLTERIELREMRSLSSYTTISVHALLGGIMPLGTRETVAATPLVFDYLRATRAGSVPPRVLYWSAHAPTVFERTDQSQMADSVAFIDDVLGRKPESTEEVVELGADQRVADWVARKLPAEPRPLFLMVHLIDTHAPYHVEPDVTPFVPYSHAATWTGLDALHNAYRDAIVAQDRSVRAVVRSFLEQVGAEPYFILFTSDHGEAFGEHQAIHHGQNVYDEQLHVPGWIAFGNGALSTEQQTWLHAHAHDFVTHLDVLPTLLDLYGVWDSFALIGARKRFVGRSLLRPFSGPSAILPITNCTALFPCPLRSYGLLRDGTAILAQPWDDDWRCVALNRGNEPLAPGTATCGDLVRASKAILPTLPNGQPNR